MNKFYFILLLTVVIYNWDVLSSSAKKISYEQNIIDGSIFHGTLFVESNIINDSDKTIFKEMTSNGRDKRTIFDRRVNKWITRNVFLFNAFFEGGKVIEVQVNPEFNRWIAKKQALKYSIVLGKIPSILMKDIKTLTINKGKELFGGGNNDILVHTRQGLEYEKQGILEEVFLHEASHTSLDSYHSNSPGWILARKKDKRFISIYAKNNPSREDIAESFPMYYALRYKSDRLKESDRRMIEEIMPNRISYFDNNIVE